MLAEGNRVGVFRLRVGILPGLQSREMNKRTVPVKGLDTHTHSRVFLCFYYVFHAFQLTGVPCKKLICGISFLLNAIESVSCVVAS